jgi:hypothetical protein
MNCLFINKSYLLIRERKERKKKVENEREERKEISFWRARQTAAQFFRNPFFVSRARAAAPQ